MFPQFGANYNHAEDMPNGTHQDWRGFRRVRPDFFHDFLQAKKGAVDGAFLGAVLDSDCDGSVVEEAAQVVGASRVAQFA